MIRARWLPRRPGAYVAVSLGLLFGAVVLAPMLTRSMALHMLVHIPLILAAGIFMGVALRLGVRAGGIVGHAVRKAIGKYNEYGVPGLLLCSFVAAYWMIPKSLDDVLFSASANIDKYVGLFLAGIVLFDALRRSNSVIKLFFLGNFSWMMAIVGLVYQDETQRLCNFYLLSDQEVAGKGLVVLAVLIPIAWLWTERSQLDWVFGKR